MSVFSNLSRMALGFGVAASFAACSDSDSSDESHASGRVDPVVAQAALNDLTSSVDTTVTSVRAPAPGAAANPGAIVVQCAAGGGASAEGHVNVVPLPVMVDVNVAVRFDGCATPSGTTLAGEVNFVQSVAVGPGTPLRVETSYQGDVDFSGSVEADCNVDLNVLVDETGRAVQLTGSFCGQDASALNLQIMPRWKS